jgi:hypothetical protein
MLIHLPIAQIAVDPLILIAIGGLVGFLSGCSASAAASC